VPDNNQCREKNFDSKALVPQSLNVGLIALYKIDKSNCAKSIVGTKGRSISYNNRSLEKKNENAEKRKAQKEEKG